MAILNIPNAQTGSSWNNSAQSSENWSVSGTGGTGAIATAQSAMNAAEANKIARENMREAMAYNAAEAQKNRDWQETMANTAYQRAVTDMKAAGINPILAASNGGAAVPAGGSASTSAAETHMANAYTDSYGESHGWGSGYSAGGSVMESNIAEQIESGIGALSNAFGELKDSNTGKKVSEVINKATNNALSGLATRGDNLNKMKDWLKDNIGLFGNKKAYEKAKK